MAITKIGSNLFTHGDSGRFESDASTWNIWISPQGVSLTRSSTYKKEGANSGRLYKGFSVSTSHTVCSFSKSLTPGKFYIVEGWFYVPTLTPEELNNVVITLQSISASQQQVGDVVGLTIGAETKGQWIQLAYSFECISTANVAMAITVSSGSTIPNFTFYIDAFTLFEYTEGEIPPPEPTEITDLYFSKNAIPFDVNASPSNILNPNYTLHCDVRVEQPKGSGTFVSKLKMELEPDVTNKSRFFLNEAFRNVLAAHVPAVNETAIQKVTSTLSRFKVYFAEKWGDDPTLQPYQISDEAMVLLGGLQKEFYPEVDFFGAYLPSKKKFLTWQPKTKKVNRLQEEYLYWLCLEDATLNLMCKLYYDTAENTEAVITLGTIAVNKYDILCLPVGFVHGGVQANGPAPELPVKKYEICITPLSNWPLSGAEVEVRTYKLDSTPAPYTRYFLFLNSLGGMDTLRTIGKTSKSFSGETEIHEHILEDNYNLQTGQFRRSFALFQNEQEVSTGHITRAEADYLQDLLLSRTVFEITSGKRVPIIIDTKSFKIFEDGEFRYYLRFKFRNAYNNEVYTPENYNSL